MAAPVLAAGWQRAAAHRLCVSHSTVRHHLANARSRVGAETTAQLVWILAPRLPEPYRVVAADGERALISATTSAECQTVSRRRRGHVVDAISTRADDR